MSLRPLFLQHVAPTSPSPLSLEIERAEGCWLYNRSGKRILDLISGISVSSLGHRHPKVVAAIKEQTDRYLHTLVYGEFILEPQVKLAVRLAEQLPPSLNCTYFVNSGAEATEGAMKLAKRLTGRPGFLSCTYAYHGSTQGAASLMWPTDFTRAFHPLLPGIGHIDFNCHRCLDRIDQQTAAVIVETVQAEWGVRKPDKGYLQALRSRCDETGALLIFDEIQAGYGRTGSLFAFEQYGVVPDILLLAKAMGGGMPLGAFIASRERMASLSHRPVLGHITTFGGHPVSCAAGLAMLEVLLEGDLIAQVPRKEAYFRRLLVHPAILDVRSAGLLMAVELRSAEDVRNTIHHCLENGVLSDWFLFNDRALRIAPPLSISEEEIEMACATILDALSALS
ncbi:MAG: aspartate aminotransferase family protein [Saprospiraceae bacterium]